MTCQKQDKRKAKRCAVHVFLVLNPGGHALWVSVTEQLVHRVPIGTAVSATVYCRRRQCLPTPTHKKMYQSSNYLVCASGFHFDNFGLALPTKDRFYVLEFDFNYRQVLAAGKHLIAIDGRF